MKMKEILSKLHAHERLDRSEARSILIGISEERYNASQIAAFISVYLMRSISVEELSGFQEALLELCVPISLEAAEAIDVCGTGGDGKNTFNISTLSAFVLAGAGKKVIKHGNYGVSSVCGSSNVLEHLGHKFSNEEDRLKKQLNTCNITFLHAPLFHPALKSVGPIRRDLGVKTFFNMLGPLVNPAQPGYQLVGVFNLKVARLYQYLLATRDVKECIVHCLGGYDEISLTSDAKISQNGKERLLSAFDFGVESLQETDIYGGETVADAAEIFVGVLKNEDTLSRKNVVCSNAALALQLYHPEISLEDCHQMAIESIESGAAFDVFKKLINS